MPSLALAVLALVLMGLAGIALFARGFRGRGIPGTRVCRGCRFDLAGLPTATSCPECGASLLLDRATMERRRRSDVLTLLGAILTVVPVLIGGGLGAAALSKVNLNTYKPVWLLKAEARGLTAGATSAITELTRRYRAGGLSADEASSLVASALPGDATDPANWNTAWADIIALARNDGLVAADQWVEYVGFAIDIDLNHRKRVRQGAESPFGYTISGPRLSAAPPAGAQASLRTFFDRISIGDAAIAREKRGSMGTVAARTGTSGSSTSYPVNLAPGTYKLSASIVIVVVASLDQEAELGRLTRTFESQIEIVPRDVALVTPKVDPSLAPKVRKSLRIQPLERTRDGRLDAMIHCDAPPLDLAFEVFARARDGAAAGEEASLGGVSFRAGGSSGYGIGGNQGSDATRVDLIFRPAAAAAESNYLITEFWSGPDIVFEDVAVKPATP